MTRHFEYFKTILCLALAKFSEADIKHKCSLQWVDFSAGNPILQTSVPSETDKIFVIRGQDNVDWTIGYFDLINDRGYIPRLENNSVNNLVTFQLLINSNNCELNWVEPGHEDVAPYSIPSDNEGNSNYLVGRGEGPDQILLGGQIDNVSKRIYIPLQNSTAILQDYFVLVAYTKRMELELSDFKFRDDIFDGSPQFVGYDEINNDSPAFITQEVIHTKRITQRMKLTSTTVSFSIATRVDSNSGYDYFLWFDKEKSSTTTSSLTVNQHTIENEDITDIQLTRIILVPPFTTIQACSILDIKENFKTSWKALATFKSLGMTGLAILNYITQQDGWKEHEFEILGDTVRTIIEGDIEGAFAIGAKFVVSPSACLAIIKGTFNEHYFQTFGNHSNKIEGSRFNWGKIKTVVRNNSRH